MSTETLRPFQHVLFLPERLLERFQYLNLELQDIFSFDKLTGKVYKELLAEVLRLNKLDSIEKELVDKDKIFCLDNDIVRSWRNNNNNKDLLYQIDQVVELAKLSNTEECPKANKFTLFHNERTIFLVIDGETPNLLNPLWSSIRRELMQALCNYYKPYVVARHPLFKVYLDDLRNRT